MAEKHLPGDWFALDRDTDMSGISGTGRVAYAYLLDSGVLMLWDTVSVALDKNTGGIEWLPDLAMLAAIHCYGGKTRLTQLDRPDEEDWRAVARAEELLRAAFTRLCNVVHELDKEMP